MLEGILAMPAKEVAQAPHAKRQVDREHRRQEVAERVRADGRQRRGGDDEDLVAAAVPMRR